ncbi:START domain containing protein [Entamoeba histolytica HM-1:IMSS-B]|uniref:START domain-containing protein n=8 Tax=Entamoeba TaxID=5758 RepID=C4M8Y1_ENTH1|nr:START domain containing protein [Entamoeba nuttalli P19]XP_649520.1 hypothetical protein EHI_080260 [Entamoeba histolytica HM-1:IMSS]EMD44866.1 START domain containing protein [Entamoeba histolytica KU27]EMH75822.1 START domain containing protein [Entamoeba histolytica HM-1:IMSS-B]EMS16701.1 START domain containing protein [Entamoeba histolytica HM-3:IMSS]ENY64018.1 START domain containing protein [Entamoeba histolytica HM-1:IMSS-A]GAT98084.1 hypothetical protein CL6EHI_080260 [Entamoeba h|eukprot:XP_008857460.1 START domain containing protein [Entamoeba nuttalli P19]
MSVEIEYCSTVNTKEEIIKKSEELKEWIDKAINEKWNPLSYNNPEITLVDQPQQEYKHLVMSSCTINANIEKVYNFLIHSTFEEQKKYDTDLLEFERDQRFEDEGCEIARVCYKAPWPVTAREFVGVQNWFQRDGKYYLLQESVNYPAKWTTPNKNYVRGYKKSGLVLKPLGDNKIEVHRVVVIDARGSIPGWLAGTAKKDDAGRLFEMKKYFEANFA